MRYGVKGFKYLKPLTFIKVKNNKKIRGAHGQTDEDVGAVHLKPREDWARVMLSAVIDDRRSSVLSRRASKLFCFCCAPLQAASEIKHLQYVENIITFLFICF